MNTKVRSRTDPGQDRPGRPRPRSTRLGPAPAQPGRAAPAVLVPPGRAARPSGPGPVPPGRPARQASPAPAPDRPGPFRPSRRARGARGARLRHSSRTPFILLVVGLLAGGLVCLLVINTTLAAGSYQIGRLQQDNSAASQRVQQLQQQVTEEQAPATIQQRALQLGMREQPVLNFVDLRDGRLYSTAANLPPEYAAPGYTP